MSPGIGRMTEAPFPVGPGGLRFLNRFAAPGLVRPPNPNHDLSEPFPVEAREAPSMPH